MRAVMIKEPLMSPLSPTLMELLAIRLSPQAGKSLVIPNPDGTTSHSTKPASEQVAGYLPLAGEGANVIPKPISGVFTPLSPALHGIHQQLKQRFDPKRIFNRGRLYPDL